MPQSITLTPYAVRIRASRSKEYFPLNDIDHDGVAFDFVSFLDSYLQRRTSDTWVDQNGQQAFRVNSHTRSQRMIRGTFEGGQFGYTAELRNVSTEVVKLRDVEDCEFIPLYFRFDHKLHQNEGILLMQRFGVHGIKSGLQTDLSEAIREKHKDLTLSINPLVTEQEIERIIGGGIKQIRYLRSSVPADVAADLNLDDNQETQCEMETVVKSKRNTVLSIPQWIKDIANGQASAGELVEINGVEYDGVKVSVSQGGRLRTLNLSQISNVRMSVDVSDDLQIDPDTGHPTYNSIDRSARGIMPEIKTELGWDDAQ